MLINDLLLVVVTIAEYYLASDVYEWSVADQSSFINFTTPREKINVAIAENSIAYWRQMNL